MIKFFLYIIVLHLFFADCFSQSGWFIQNSNTDENLYSLSFVDENTGWCVGNNGVILKTIDGGINWKHQFSGYQNNLRSLVFTSDNTGYAVGEMGIILKTTNGGDSWISSTVIDPSYDFYSVYFLDDYLGFAGGIIPNRFKSFPILKTTNGGLRWDSVNYGGDFVKSIFFVDSNTGWIIFGGHTIGSDLVKKTTNGGANWTQQFGAGTLNSLFFLDSLTGWTAGLGSGPAIFKTVNGGNNWSPCFFCGMDEVYSIYFINYQKGWVTSVNSIFSTVNGGDNWTSYPNIHETKIMNEIDFIDTLTGWIVGENGLILKTTNGGILTNFSNASSEIPNKYFLSQNYPNPFNPETNLEFGISNLGFVSLKVFDVLGNEVAILVNETKAGGSYQVEFYGSNFASGIYFYRLEVNGNHIDTKRMILLK